jgi:hypothetical protein
MCQELLADRLAGVSKLMQPAETQRLKVGATSGKLTAVSALGDGSLPRFSAGDASKEGSEIWSARKDFGRGGAPPAFEGHPAFF